MSLPHDRTPPPCSGECENCYLVCDLLSNLLNCDTKTILTVKRWMDYLEATQPIWDKANVIIPISLDDLEITISDIEVEIFDLIEVDISDIVDVEIEDAEDDDDITNIY